MKRKSSRRKTAFVEQMARVAWQEYPGHFGGALSKALVGPENSGSARTSLKASTAIPSPMRSQRRERKPMARGFPPGARR